MKIFASVQRTAQKCRWIGINFRWTKTKHAAKPSAAQIPKPSPPYNKTLYRGGANRRHRHWEMDTTRCLCGFHNPWETPLHSKIRCRGSMRFVCHCFFIPTFAVFCLPLQFFTYLCLFLRLPDQKGVGHPDNALSVQLCWTDIHHALHSPQRYPPQSRNAGKVGMGNFF